MTKKRQLGEGAFSYVDLVQDCSTGQYYALKRIICHDKNAVNQGLEEAKVHKEVEGDFLIKCTDFCVKKRSPFSEVWLLLPYYSNGTLWDKFQEMKRNSKSFSEEELLNLMIQIAQGVANIHERGYTHRDLKPANILMDNLIPVICDLGSCEKGETRIDSKQQAQKILDSAAEKSTLPYRAPELFDCQVDDVISNKTDIWSLGCILYSLVYLEGPFDQHWLKGDSVHLAIQSLNFDKQKFSNYSNEIADIISDCIYPDPEFRPDAKSIIERTKALQNTIS